MSVKLSVECESPDDLVAEVNNLHRILQQARAHTGRPDTEVLEMIERANQIGLRRAAAEYRVSPSWLSKVRAGKLRPHLKEMHDAATVSGI